MNHVPYFIAGVALGAFSWAVCPLVSGHFEPFDTSLGLIIGQMSMLLLAIYTGWAKKLGFLLLLLVGMYLGQNLYAYAFGSSEIRAWMLLGLFSTLLLCILPSIGGFIARGVSLYVQRTNESI
jgi:hypothetical protein